MKAERSGDAAADIAGVQQTARRNIGQLAPVNAAAVDHLIGGVDAHGVPRQQRAVAL